MQKTATNNLILTDSSSLERLAELPKQIVHTGFYQQLVTLGLLQHTCAKAVLSELDRYLAALTEHACTLRRMDIAESREPDISESTICGGTLVDLENLWHTSSTSTVLRER